MLTEWLLELDKFYNNFVTFNLSFWSNYTFISWLKVHTWFIAFTMKKLNAYCAYQKLVNQYHLLKSPQRNNQETVWCGLHFVLYMRSETVMLYKITKLWNITLERWISWGSGQWPNHQKFMNWGKKQFSPKNFTLTFIYRISFETAV